MEVEILLKRTAIFFLYRQSDQRKLLRGLRKKAVLEKDYNEQPEDAPQNYSFFVGWEELSLYFEKVMKIAGFIKHDFYSFFAGLHEFDDDLFVLNVFY